jgi:hypothetical protein
MIVYPHQWTLVRTFVHPTPSPSSPPSPSAAAAIITVIMTNVVGGDQHGG